MSEPQPTSPSNNRTPVQGDLVRRRLVTTSAGQAPRVLVVEDHPDAQTLLFDMLESIGCRVTVAGSAAEAIGEIQGRDFDLVLLDLMLPDVDGLAVCRTLRQARPTPIIILSALTDERKKVEAFDAGADDYLTKPVGRAEFAARISAALRRPSLAPNRSGRKQEVYIFGDLVVNVPAYTVRRGGRVVTPTPNEWKLLIAFCQNPGLPLTFEALIESIWDDEAESGMTALQACVRRLRRKLGEPELIESIRGVGYQLRVPA